MSTEQASPTVLPADLLRWVAAQAGGAVTAVSRVPGGASRLSYFLRLGTGGAAERVFLRMDSGQGGLSGTRFTLAREASLLQALQDSTVALPRVFGYNDPHRALLLECVAGTSDYGSVAEPDRALAIQDGLIEQLARLHGPQTDLGATLGAEVAPTAAAALQSEIEQWRDLYRERVADRDPALEFALRWLARHIPCAERPPALVHGDIGPGNFLFDGTRVTALIDWELAHAGHPLEDLACVIARTLGVPFGEVSSNVAAYERHSGHPVVRSELAYCLALVLTRFCVAMDMAIARPSAAADLSILLRFFQANRHALLRLLARLEDLDEGHEPVVPAAGTEGLIYDHAIAVLNELLAPALTDPYLQQKCRGLVPLTAHLRDLAAYGTDRLRHEQLTELGALCESPPDDDLAAARRRLVNSIGTATGAANAAILRWLLHDSWRRHRLMRDALGAMYARELRLD